MTTIALYSSGNHLNDEISRKYKISMTEKIEIGLPEQLITISATTRSIFAKMRMNVKSLKHMFSTAILSLR